MGHLDHTAQLALHLDASSSHIGAALNQWPKGHSTWQPLSFFSHRLEAAQAKWSVFELLTCLESIRHFWFILQGRAFTIYTDHKPLVGLCHGSPTHGRQGSAATWPTWMSSHWTSGMWLGRRTWLRMLCQGLQFPSPILNLLPLLQWWLTSIGLLHVSCPAPARCKQGALPPSRSCKVKGVRILCDTSTGHLRPLVPQEDRLFIFEAIYNVAHPGIRSIQRMISTCFLWQRMNSDIASWCRDCVACQCAKVTK